MSNQTSYVSMSRDEVVHKAVKLTQHKDFLFYVGLCAQSVLGGLLLFPFSLFSSLGYYEAIGFNMIVSVVIGYVCLIFDRKKYHADIPMWTLIVPLVYIWKRARKGVNLKLLGVAFIVCLLADISIENMITKNTLSNEVNSILVDVYGEHRAKISIGSKRDSDFFDEARNVTIRLQSGATERFVAVLEHETSTIDIVPEFYFY